MLADSMERCTCLRNVTDLFSDGKTPLWKTFWSNHSNDRSFRVVHWLSGALYLRRISRESINLERKSYSDCSSDTLCTRVEFERVTYWLQTLRSWKRWTHRKSTGKDSMRKKWYFPEKKENLFFQSKMDDQNPWRSSGPENFHFSYGNDQFKEKISLIFYLNQKGLFHHLTTRFRMPVKRLMSSGPCQETSYTAIVAPRVKLYSPNEESFTIPLKCIDASWTICTNFDVKEEKRIDDYWNIDGSRDLSDPWTSFTQFTWLEEKHPDGYMWSGVRLTRKQKTSRPDHLWPELWKSMGKHAKLKEKQRWSEEKLHLENARKFRKIYVIDPEDMNSKK